MARYDVRLAALVLDVPYPWLDVLLARHDVPGVGRAESGARRTISDDGLLTLAIARDLHHELGLPAPRALRVAATLAATGCASVGVVSLNLDVAALRRQLLQAAADGVERVIPRRRGRPPKRRPAAD